MQKYLVFGLVLFSQMSLAKQLDLVCVQNSEKSGLYKSIETIRIEDVLGRANFFRSVVDIWGPYPEPGFSSDSGRVDVEQSKPFVKEYRLRGSSLNGVLRVNSYIESGVFRGGSGVVRNYSCRVG